MSVKTSVSVYRRFEQRCGAIRSNALGALSYVGIAREVERLRRRQALVVVSCRRLHRRCGVVVLAIVRRFDAYRYGRRQVQLIRRASSLARVGAR